ncbi:DUF3379 family protein [Aliikangiella maris]|uniref:DUF3379 family protein n=2 Tax=Aliikangiella maris TaxID=3162458 RepID=A0ABV3MTZ4_9GAMM
MDELEKKRAQRVDPLTQQQQIDNQTYQQMTPAQQQHLRDEQRFEKQLQDAFKFEINPALANKILFNQHLQNRKKLGVKWAIAASIAFISIMTFWQASNMDDLPPMQVAQQNVILEDALFHVQNESEYLALESLMSPEDINRQLSRLNIELTGLPDKITFATKCKVAGKTALHMIAQVDGAPVTLFIAPKAVFSPTDLPQSFSNPTWQGELQTFANNGIIVIAKDRAVIKPVLERIKDV